MRFAEVPSDLVLEALHQESTAAGKTVAVLSRTQIKALARSVMAEKWTLREMEAFASLRRMWVPRLHDML